MQDRYPVVPCNFYPWREITVYTFCWSAAIPEVHENPLTVTLASDNRYRQTDGLKNVVSTLGVVGLTSYHLKNLGTQREVHEFTWFSARGSEHFNPGLNCLAGHKEASGLCTNVLCKCVFQQCNQCFCYVASEGWYWQGETEEFGEEPVPVLLCPIKLLHELAWDWTRYSATNRLMKRPTDRRYESAQKTRTFKREGRPN